MIGWLLMLAWTGVMALVLYAAISLAYRRRYAQPRSRTRLFRRIRAVDLTVWLPAMLLLGLAVVGLLCLELLCTV
jgi:hypothetical protein